MWLIFNPEPGASTCHRCSGLKNKNKQKSSLIAYSEEVKN